MKRRKSEKLWFDPFDTQARKGFQRILLSSAAAVFLAGCRRHSEARAYADYLQHIVAADQAYCAPSAAEARDRLRAAQAWFLQRKYDGKKGFTYDLQLTTIEGRLFVVNEFLGQTNEAQKFYEEAVDTYAKYLKTAGRPPYRMSEGELRQLVAAQERALRVGWRNQVTNASALSPNAQP
jgi:hypothetical protein